MKVYKDFLSDSEFFSDAKDIEPVLDEAGTDTGLVRVRVYKQTQGGTKVDVGGSGEFTKASEDDGDDAEETKFDQFWTFPDIENEHSFSTFKEFKDIALMPALMAFKKLAIAKGLATDKDDVKAKGMRIAGPGFKWLQANFKSIQFFSVEVPTLSGSDHGCDDIETLSAQYGFLIDDGEKPYMYFLRDLFVASRF